jgi:hypothetical protein
VSSALPREGQSAVLVVCRVPVPPDRAWRDADEALEGPAERGLGLVAEADRQISEPRVVLLEPRQRDVHSPARDVVHGGLADEANALVQAGLSESFAGLYVEMTRAFNEGKVKPRQDRTPENTTPTRFEDFAGELARAYQAA